MVNKGTYVKPWKRLRELQKKYSMDEVPSIYELVNLTKQIGELSKDSFKLRNQALFVMYYLTGCRASEILKTDKLRKRKKDIDTKITNFWVEDHFYQGIRNNQINYEYVEGHKIMHIRTENRKNKQRIMKKLPVPCDLESELIEFLESYRSTLKEEDYLFKFKTKRATQIINKYTGFNIHFIRHIRATHLITLYDFNEQALIKYMGWSDGRPAKFYVELGTKDMVREFYKKKRIESQ